MRLRPCPAGFVQGAGCWIGQNPSPKRRDGWHAGMVAEWDQNAALRATLRKRLIERINAFKPDVIMAHSLGSVICYDAFSHEDKNACAGRYLVTFGSQIANPFLKAAHFDNKIVGVNQKYWFHLFNKSDPVLAHRIVDRVPNFEEISWDDSVAGHDAVVDLEKFPDHAGYLQRDLTWQRVYRVLAQRRASALWPAEARNSRAQWNNAGGAHCSWALTIIPIPRRVWKAA